MYVKLGPYVEHHTGDRIIKPLRKILPEHVCDTIEEYVLWPVTRVVNQFKRRKRQIKVVVHGYDAWNADSTLALIIVPVLKEFRSQLHGAPDVDDEDVPDHLKRSAAPALSEKDLSCGCTDENWQARWEWVIDEMIWAFTQVNEDWEDQFYSGEHDHQWTVINPDAPETEQLSELSLGPKDTFAIDKDGMKAYAVRMQNGYRLFGKYYRNLWD